MSRRQAPAPLVTLPDWTREPRHALSFGLVVADLIFYAVAVDALGFLVTAVVFLAVLMWSFGVRPRVIGPVAVGVALAVHVGFYTVLRVPLPWGLLEGIAW
jgi:putative tricarboxylic transport membrane protein